MEKSFKPLLRKGLKTPNCPSPNMKMSFFFSERFFFQKRATSFILGKIDFWVMPFLTDTDWQTSLSTYDIYFVAPVNRWLFIVLFHVLEKVVMVVNFKVRSATTVLSKSSHVLFFDNIATTPTTFCIIDLYEKVYHRNRKLLPLQKKWTNWFQRKYSTCMVTNFV